MVNDTNSSPQLCSEHTAVLWMHNSALEDKKVNWWLLDKFKYNLVLLKEFCNFVDGSLSEKEKHNVAYRLVNSEKLNGSPLIPPIISTEMKFNKINEKM